MGLEKLNIMSQEFYNNKPFNYKFRKKNGGLGGMSDMVLLDHKGNPQMEMEGGELIFSRISTKKIVDLASDIKSESDEESLLKLGKYVMEERLKQRQRELKK